MEYRVLGEVEVLRDGERVALGSYRQRALMALLLSSPNMIWSTDRIIDALWGDDIATDHQNALWVYVSGLRKALEPDRRKRTEGTILLTRSPGYLVEVSAEETDSLRFERLLAEGRALVDTDPDAAGLVLGEALALWRGRPFEEFVYESWAQPVVDRLEGLRLEAVEARIDADLLRGMSRELVSELESLVREHPLQERFTGQLMLALHRSGRQADSLRTYQQLRARLGGELGIEPSSGIRQLEELIVTGAESLADSPRVRVVAGGPEPGLAVRGYELRDRLGERGSGLLYRAFQPSVGREVAIKVIRPELANDPGFIRRFEAEAQLVARLEHPHIVPLYDFWREPDAAYLVMRLMKGGMLADRLRERALTSEEAAQLVDQVGSALATAHRAGVTHGDVTVENILIDDDGNTYLSDFAIAADHVAPMSDVVGLATVITNALTGLSGGIDQLRGGLAPPVRDVVDRANGDDPGGRFDSITEFVADLRSALGEADVSMQAVEIDNPYKGLRPFDAADALDFHGRERLVERLLARLGEPGQRGRFVAVVGPSGSGKSSLVKAGLLPAIHRGALSGRWFTVGMTPGPHPFEALEEALLGIAVDPPASLLEQLAAGESGIRRAVRRVLPDDGSQVLLVIDQFEELFTQVDDDGANRFIDALVDAVTDDHSRIRVVATMRADFYDRPLRHRGLGELLREGTELITPMTPEELDRAISGPVEGSGIAFEPALVAELVRAVVDRAGALPLLQYTLTELFDGRKGNRITRADYDELGGVSGALVQRAEGLYAGLGDEAQQVTRLVFLRLVTLGEGTDDTRRRVLRSELEELAVDRRFLDGVIDAFGRHRLISFDRDPVTRGPTIEISHEALLTEWARLRQWIDGARHDVRNQRRLAEAMNDWIGSGRSDEYLLRGGRLDQLHGWATTTSLPLSGPEMEFLEASRAERDRVANDALVREQRATEAERRARRRVRQLAALGIVATLITGLAVYGFVQQREASAAKRDVESLLTAASIASASQEELRRDPELALLLAVAAVRSTADLGFATEGAVDSVHWALQELRVPYDVGPATPIAVRSGPNGTTGVWALPPSRLVEAAESATERVLTGEECQRHLSMPCPPVEPVPADLALVAGMDAYLAHRRPPALAGTTVRLVTPWDEWNEHGLDEELAAFEARTGIRVERDDGSVQTLAAARADGADIPDVVVVPQPGAFAQLARDGAFVGLTGRVDLDDFRADFGDHLADLMTIGFDGSWPSSDGVVYGIPVDVDLKGLVFYPKGAFDAAGYEIPSTWDELMALSNRMVADGEHPWCIGFASGAAGGWPGTDLIESLVLRIGGTETYDRWADHRIPFDDPVAQEAADRWDEVLFEQDFVRLGPASISGAFYGDQLFSMLRRDRLSGDIDPECWLHPNGDFMLNQLPADAALGDDVDFFLLPPVDPDRPTPSTGGGNVAGALSDRPEVRAFMQFLTEPEWGEAWARHPGENHFLSPNARFDVTNYETGTDTSLDAVRKALGVEALAALEQGVFRFDASDLMPGTIGAFGPAGAGSFWTGMLDWVDGARPIHQVLTDIENDWVAHESAGTS